MKSQGKRTPPHKKAQLTKYPNKNLIIFYEIDLFLVKKGQKHEKIILKIKKSNTYKNEWLIIMMLIVELSLIDELMGLK